MTDVTEDLRILYRAVCRKQGRAIAYAGCLTAREAVCLSRLGLGKIVDVQTDDDASTGDYEQRQPIAGAIRVAAGASGGLSDPSQLLASLGRAARPNDILMFLSATTEASHRAATLAADAGFFCVLNILDGRGCYREASGG